jgi:hypothetical protein
MRPSAADVAPARKGRAASGARRRLVVGAAVAAISLFGAGCSSGSSESGSSGTGAATSVRAKAVKFSECMRDNGVGAFPDPDASGEMTIEAR